MPDSQSKPVQVDGRTLRLSHLDKVLWPDTGWTKGQALDYYARVARTMVPHLAARPASFVRFPEGLGGERFYAKNPPPGLPGWVRRVDVPSRSDEGGSGRPYVAIDDRASLIAMAQLYALEVHVPQWTAETGPDRHDRLVVDLDPGEGRNLVDCCAVALLVRERLAEDGLECWAKTSGGKGLHLYVPLRAAASPAEPVTEYARRVAAGLADEHPNLIVHRMTRSLRADRVFIDWSQNNSAKTTAAPYTLRARGGPSVSTPVDWEEVAGCVSPEDLAFTPDQVLDRIFDRGDLLAPLLDPERAADPPVD
jgi:bifunctional non-homologous end joining protein LigD